MLSRKAILLLVLFQGAIFMSFADKGVGKRKASNIVTDVRYKAGKIDNLSLSLRSGLKYTGGLYYQNNSANNLVTYKKGNSIYIVPQKKVVVAPDYRTGYAGVKLVISKN